MGSTAAVYRKVVDQQFCKGLVEIQQMAWSMVAVTADQLADSLGKAADTVLTISWLCRMVSGVLCMVVTPLVA
jgi:hypothetical protein